MNLNSAVIVCPEKCAPTLRYAALELKAHIGRLVGKAIRVSDDLPARGVGIVLDQDTCAALGVSAPETETGAHGYRLQTGRSGELLFVALAAPHPVGVLYACYDLLQRLGIGFHVLGPAYPDTCENALIEDDLDVCARPAFRVRGQMLHYNFLCGVTCWGLNDYKFYFDQMARMRDNTLLMHWYDSEPGAAYEMDGIYRAGGRTPGTLSKVWGATAALRTSEFSFNTGRCFAGPIYSSPQGEAQMHVIDEIKQSEQMFASAVSYAKVAGINVAAGFEAFRDDPTLPGVHERFNARLRQFLERNPELTYFALWQHESGGCTGTVPPAENTPGRKLFDKLQGEFAYLGNQRRVWEAIRFGEYARWAASILQDYAPGIRLVIVGWGGDRWMRFADYCLAYDKRLPASVIFCCHDNIDAGFSSEVSAAWGQLPPERERWAMPWIENDLDDCWVRQPAVESIAALAADAAEKGAQGLLTLAWRPGGCEEEYAFTARLAWNRELTPERFYLDYARECFGRRNGSDLGPQLLELARQGSRWTGVRGTPECTKMQWAWRVPHPPFDLDAAGVVPHLLKLASATASALSENVGAEAETAAGAFHERESGAVVKEVTLDHARLGVCELEQAIADLQLLSACVDEEVLRVSLAEIKERLWPVRTELVKRGMTAKAHGALDTLLLDLHYLNKNAGATVKMAQVKKLSGFMHDLERRLKLENRIDRARLARRLAATLDFAFHFDAAVMLLAADETVEQAIARAQTFSDDLDAAAAAEVAASAYSELVTAGMHRALDACTRKLDTRCDWGTLATLNVKPMPLYWRAVERLEQFLPTAPPREVHAQGRPDEIWVAWTRPKNAAALRLHRRKAGETAWALRAELPAECEMFNDRDVVEGRYEYAVSAVDGNQWESPKSHDDSAAAGVPEADFALYAPIPPGRVSTGEALEVQVTVAGGYDLADVRLFFRDYGKPTWSDCVMTGHNRNFSATLEKTTQSEGLLQYFVQARDRNGNTVFWPETTGEGVPWTVAVLNAVEEGD